MKTEFSKLKLPLKVTLFKHQEEALLFILEIFEIPILDQDKETDDED